MEKKLTKSRSGNKLDGVCMGLSKYLGIDVTLIRIIWVLFALSGTGVIAYILCAILMPRESEVIDYTDKSDREN